MKLAVIIPETNSEIKNNAERPPFQRAQLDIRTGQRGTAMPPYAFTIFKMDGNNGAQRHSVSNLVLPGLTYFYPDWVGLGWIRLDFPGFIGFFSYLSLRGLEVKPEKWFDLL